MLRNRLPNISKKKKKEIISRYGRLTSQWEVRIMDRDQGLDIKNLSKIYEVAIGRTHGYLGCYWADE